VFETGRRYENSGEEGIATGSVASRPSLEAERLNYDMKYFFLAAGFLIHADRFPPLLLNASLKQISRLIFGALPCFLNFLIP
jgi:hypothetical protein